ncbi:MAG: inositol monophosphatase [Proteobacteria bacterium]|nr:inositol monophosphatase [Pseudomonadota bacterium]
MDPRLEHLGSLISDLARKEILSRFLDTPAETKADGSLLTEADSAMQSAVIKALKKKYPKINVLGEEMSADQQQAMLNEGNPFWCVDPLDGTTNFAAGMPVFSVSVALVEQGKPVLGVVYDPIRGECFSAAAGQGAWLNGLPLHVRPWTRGLSEAVAVVDFKRLSRDLSVNLVTDPPYRSQRNLGTCALEWAWLAAGRFQLYLHGGQKLWDHAAGALIAREAGVQVLTPQGEPVIANDLAPCPVLAATDMPLWVQWHDEVSPFVTQPS